ncbi:vasotab-like [Lucilia sericata]|uniref:vasotab-like n=1 Tax=Lucilia sericata TaxID=13632 RepID=UPI0018A7F350|nr:vasotab-like [Lucilia sericata]
MHLPIRCLILLWNLFFCVMGDDCKKECPLDYKPICATVENSEGQPIVCTFPNDCSLEIHTCMSGKEASDQKEDFCEDQDFECTDIILRTFKR